MSDGDRLARVLSHAAGMRAPPEGPSELVVINRTGNPIQFEGGPLLKHGRQWKIHPEELKHNGLKVLPAPPDKPSEAARSKPPGKA